MTQRRRCRSPNPARTHAIWPLLLCIGLGVGVVTDPCAQQLSARQPAASQSIEAEDPRIGQARRAFENRDYAGALQIVEDYAWDGNARAQAWTGYLYEQGLGVEKSYPKALGWYREGAAREDRFAQLRLGQLLESGRGTATDLETALRWYRRSAEQGAGTAMRHLARLLREDPARHTDGPNAEHWERRAEAAPGPEILGHSRLVGNVDLFTPLSFREALARAQEGDANAQAQVGYAYLNGLGTPYDATKAAQWYLQAAVQEHGGSQIGLAYILQTGRSGPPDYEQARFWYERAAAQNLPAAQNNLGYIYHLGQGVDANLTRAVEFYGLAADQGFPQGQNNLGHMYLHGLGPAATR